MAGVETTGEFDTFFHPEKKMVDVFFSNSLNAFSSASGVEALEASRAEILTAAGHNVKSSWCLAKWPSRGQLASTRRIVAEHFEWLVLQDGGKPTWVCKHSTWTNQMRGFVRPMEHIMFWEAMKPKNYLIIHELQRVDDIPAQFQQFLEKYSSKNLRNFLQRKNPSEFFTGTGPKFQLVFINLPAFI